MTPSARWPWWLSTMACWAVVLAHAVAAACADRWGWSGAIATAAAASALTAWAAAPWRAPRLRESTRGAIVIAPALAGMALVVVSGTAPAYRWWLVADAAGFAALMVIVARRRERTPAAASPR